MSNHSRCKDHRSPSSSTRSCRSPGNPPDRGHFPTNAAQGADDKPNDPTFAALLAALAALPKRRRNAILAYLNTIQSEDLELLAIFLKGQRPETSDDQIARICGVSRATVARWERYQAAKPNLTDYVHVRRPSTRWRRMKGDRWPLDHPDRV